MSMLSAQTDHAQFSFFSHKRCRKTFISSQTEKFSQVFENIGKQVSLPESFSETMMGDTSENLMQNLPQYEKNKEEKGEIIAAFYYRQEKISWSYSEEHIRVSENKQFFANPLERLMASVSKHLSIGLRKVERVIYNVNFQITGYMLEDSSLDGQLGLNRNLVDFYEKVEKDMEAFIELVEKKGYSVKNYSQENSPIYADIYEMINGVNYWEDLGIDELWEKLKEGSPGVFGNSFGLNAKNFTKDSIYYASVLDNIWERFPNSMESDTKIS